MRTLIAAAVLAAGVWGLSPVPVAGTPHPVDDPPGMFDPGLELDTSNVVWLDQHQVIRRCHEDCGVED